MNVTISTEIMNTVLLALAAVFSLAALILAAVACGKASKNLKENARLQGSLKGTLEQMRLSTASAIESQGAGFSRSLHHVQEGVSAQIGQMGRAVENLRRENERQLTEIRGTVDEQLQETLDRKLKQSFDSVAEQLGRVQQGLGEMQSLASSVGDLKKVLSGTKTRGILGEAQLGAILEQMLSPEQYETNVCTVKGSRDPVEFAIKLPGGDEGPVYLPIDAKFPLETYQKLQDACDAGDRDLIAAAEKALEQRIRSEAKDIHEKYIHVPETTDFGILFLPVEGLYAESVKMGLVDALQNKYHIMIAGPTTMSALLNSLQMGFRTLAIQERSAEVWKLLGNVKSEFETFGATLEKTQQRLTQAGEELEKLVGVRTKQINRKLAEITDAPELRGSTVYDALPDKTE